MEMQCLKIKIRRKMADQQWRGPLHLKQFLNFSASLALCSITNFDFQLPVCTSLAWNRPLLPWPKYHTLCFLNIFGYTRCSNWIVTICIRHYGRCSVPVIYFRVQIKTAVNSFIPFNYLPAIRSKPPKY
jgi:hypothetical protein